MTAVDNTFNIPGQRSPLVTGHADYTSITNDVCKIAEQYRPPRSWYIAFAISLSVLGVLGLSVVYLITTGIGVWGNNNPAFWGFDIVNFVFWVGIGHAGTLISAILFLFRQQWRTSINRMAEAMTIFAVMCAGLFPAIHVGRVWLVYWLAPAPNYLALWPNFRSPLLWDVFAVSTYATVSLLFWYLGMIPDLATLRDRATTKLRRFAYGVFSLGWTGSARAWHRYERAYLLLAALATPLVLSVHSVVSFDFAVSQLPGWHTTIFPPYFVAGAIFSGFAMVITLAVPARAYFGLKNLITDAAPGEHQQGHPGDQPDGRLRVWRRTVHGLVQPEPVRDVCLPGQSPAGTVRRLLRDHGHLQRTGSPAVLVQEVPHDHLDHGDHRDPGQCRHVDGTIRDHDVAYPRLPALELGHVHSHAD